MRSTSSAYDSAVLRTLGVAGRRASGAMLS
jgi:hypothetical protein